jgi:hypothetical protein
MPIANQSFAKYYANSENRDKLLKKMRERYDSDKRKQRYADNRDEIRQREKENYKKRKENASRLYYTALWESHCATEEAKTKIKAFIDSEGYKGDSKKMRDYWVCEVQKVPEQ